MPSSAVAHAAIAGDARIRRRRRLLDAGERRRQMLEAVMPADFLDQIDLRGGCRRATAAQPRPSRCRAATPWCGRLGDLETERRQDPLDVRVRHVHAEQAGDPRALERQRLRLMRARVDVGDCAGRRSRADLSRAARSARAIARGGAVESMPRSKRVDASVLSPSALLVARIDAGLNHAASNTICVVRVGDFRIRAAHHAADGFGAFGVGDHQHVRPSASRFLPSSVVIVSPAFARRTSITPPRSFVEIERVHRLAELEQHVVGDVDDVADRADAARLEAVLHPLRRRADGDVGDRRRRSVRRDPAPRS